MMQPYLKHYFIRYTNNAKKQLEFERKNLASIHKIFCWTFIGPTSDVTLVS